MRGEKRQINDRSLRRRTPKLPEDPRTASRRRSLREQTPKQRESQATVDSYTSLWKQTRKLLGRAAAIPPLPLAVPYDTRGSSTPRDALNATIRPISHRACLQPHHISPNRNLRGLVRNLERVRNGCASLYGLYAYLSRSDSRSQ
jgi:hypothetical protein